ncbi:hypothetical protein Tco_0776311 [Tanacetum coccineum]
MAHNKPPSANRYGKQTAIPNWHSHQTTISKPPPPTKPPPSFEMGRVMVGLDLEKGQTAVYLYQTATGDSDDDNDDDDQQSNDERTEFDDGKATDPNKTDDEEEDEFVHTPNDYVPTNDENVDDEEYDHIHKEMYDDVNMELKVAEPANEEKSDEEMSYAERVDAEHEEVSQEVAGDQVKDDAQAIVTAVLATQKTEAPVSDLEKEVKELKIVDHSSALLATIKSEVLTAVKEYLRTSLDDALYKVHQRYTANLSKEHSILADVVEKLKQQDKPQKSAKDILKIKMEQAGEHQEAKYIITSYDTAKLQEFDQKRTLFKTMTKTKSFNKNTKHKALYHALMKSILEDENAMDKGVVDKSKKRKPYDDDKNKGPPTGSVQGLKRKKTCKETKSSKKAKSTGTSKGTTKSQPKSTGKSAQAEETMFEAKDTQGLQNLGEDMGNTDETPIVNVDPKDWFKKPERPPTPDPEWNECKSVDNKPTQKWLSDLAKAEKSSKTFNDLMSTPIDFSAFVMNRLQISDLTQEILVGPA